MTKRSTAAPPFRIAVVATVYYPVSHADVFLSRWLTPRPTDADWGWDKPRTQLASLYVEQFPDNDIARATAARHGLPMFDSIEDALTLGGDELAVDGVMLIGEHGDYPINKLGQKLYPRKAMFDQIVRVFEACGRCVPVFCDKHFAWDFKDACAMVETAKRMNFLLVGGSSLPHARASSCWPSLAGEEVREAVGVFYGEPPRGDESHGIHCVEIVQALVEARRGGESGVRAVTAYEAQDVWRQQDAGRWSADLVEAAAAANPRLNPGDMRTNCRAAGRNLAAWVVEHADGLQVTYLNLLGHVKGWSAALRRGAAGSTYATAPRTGDRDNHYAHFATFSRIVEEALMTGRSGFPQGRTLLATGLINAMLRARQQPGVPLPTPELVLPYRPAQ